MPSTSITASEGRLEGVGGLGLFYRIQILTLQLVAMLRVLTQNSESIRGAVASLKGFRLAPLSSVRVRRLLGI